ncbi:MAG: branched-chain amino acid ABC transporter permease [Candidatus Liptonbacteria bacterium]|nr:branched-chain amino acid ABC transporter permease [Candidatus Liptonbacteria bacterium]
MEVILQILINGILAASVYGLIAGGLSFLYATTKIFHLAHGVVVVGGGYAFWWAAAKLGWPMWAAVIFALIVSALAGVAMNEFVYEVLRKKGTKGLGYLIATLALLTLGTAVVLALFGAAPKTFNFETSSHEALGVVVTTLQFWIIATSALLLGIFYWTQKFTKFGKAMRATADNETVAEVLGIDTKRIRRSAFALSSILAAAAGILIGLEFNLDPNMGVLLAVKGFAASVIGGVGSFGGAIIGSLIIGIVEQVVVWFGGAGWRNAATFLILFLFLLFKPSGLFGSKRET